MGDAPSAPDHAPADEEAQLFIAAAAQNSQMAVQVRINAAHGPALHALLTATDSQGKTALHLAAASGHAYMAERLLQAGAAAATLDRAGETPAMLAAAGGHKMVLQKLAVAAGGSSSGHSSVLEFLLQLPGANPHCADPARGGMPALACAAYAGNIRSVQVLLSAGASVRAVDTAWKTPMHWAAEGDHAAVMALLLRHGASLDAPAGPGTMTVLHFASQGGQASVLQELLRLPLFMQNVSTAVTPGNSQHSTTALHLAAQGGHLEAVKVLLSANPDMNAMDADGATALQLAAANGHAAVLQELATRCSLLISMGAWRRCYSPLHLAASKGLCEVIKVLVDTGSPIDAVGTRGDGALESPVMVAAVSGQLQAMKVLLSRGAAWEWFPERLTLLWDQDVRFVPLALTRELPRIDNVLHHAVRQGDMPMLSMLLSISGSHVYLHRKGKYGSTPLEMALDDASPDALIAIAENLQQANSLAAAAGAESAGWDMAWFSAAKLGKTNHFSVLSDRGRRVNMRNDEGLTALHLASQQGQDAAVQRLIAMGESVSSTSTPPAAADGAAAPQAGNTPLHLAVRGNHASTVTILLKAGAPAGHTNAVGYTPLHEAAAAGSEESLSALLKAPAARAALDLDAGGTNGTALHVAALWDKGAVAAQLVAAGADVSCENSIGRTPLRWGVFRGAVSVVEALAQHYPVPDQIAALLDAARNPMILGRAEQQHVIRVLVRKILATGDRAASSAALRLALEGRVHEPVDADDLNDVKAAFKGSKLAAETAICIIKVYEEELTAALAAADAASAEARDIGQQRLAVQHLICGLAGTAKQGLDAAAREQRLEQQKQDFDQQMQAERQRMGQRLQQQSLQFSGHMQAEHGKLQQTVDAKVQQEKARQEQQWQAERVQVLQAAQGQGRQIVQAAEDQRRTVLASLDQQAADKRAQLAALDKQAKEKQALLQQICAQDNKKEQFLQQITQQGLQAQQQLQQLKSQISSAEQHLQRQQLQQVSPALQQAHSPTAPQHTPMPMHGRC